MKRHAWAVCTVISGQPISSLKKLSFQTPLWIIPVGLRTGTTAGSTSASTVAFASTSAATASHRRGRSSHPASTVTPAAIATPSAGSG